MIYTELSQLPKSESDRWEHAEVWPDGRRWVSRFRIDSQIAEDLEGFLKEVADRLNEWRSGYYVAQEVALILKSVVPGLDARGLVEQMKNAVIEGELIIRKNHIPIKQADLNLDIIYGAKFRLDDVNKWLALVGAKYQLSYPYDDEKFDDKSQAAPAIEPVTPVAMLALPPLSALPVIRHKLRTNSLDAPISKAVKVANSLATGAVYLELRNLALNCESPFTGDFEGDALLYTKDDNKTVAKLSKKNLGKRLKSHSL